MNEAQNSQPPRQPVDALHRLADLQGSIAHGDLSVRVPLNQHRRQAVDRWDGRALVDFAHCFNQRHPIAFEAASRMVALAPGFDHIFFTNSGGAERSFAVGAANAK